MGLYMLILLNLLFIPFYSTKAQDAKTGIIPVLNSLEITVEEINVNAHVNMEKEFLLPLEAKTKALKIAEEFEVLNHGIEDFSTWDNTQIILQGNTEELHKITIIVQATDIPDITETNIVVDILAQESSMETSILEEKLRKVLEPYGSVDINSNITASHRDKLTILQQKEIIGELMKALEATAVETFTDENMVSVTGYSNQIKQWKQYANNKVNVNVAMRYNSYEDKTNLWLGSPFITIGY